MAEASHRRQRRMTLAKGESFRQSCALEWRRCRAAPDRPADDPVSNGLSPREARQARRLRTHRLDFLDDRGRNCSNYCTRNGDYWKRSRLEEGEDDVEAGRRDGIAVCLSRAS